MHSTSRGAALLLVAAVACAQPVEPAKPAPRRAQPAEAYRPLDGLLESAALRRIVEAQVDREADSIVAVLGHPDARVRARAAFALASVQDTAAVPALIQALDDVEPAVRADVAHALGQTPAPAGARALVERIRVETDTVVLAMLLDAAGRAGGRAELEALAADPLVDPDGAPEVAAALALAYARFGMRGHHAGEAIDWLVEALGAPDRAVRANAAYFFARSSSPDAWRERRPDILDALERYDRADRSAMHLLTALGRLQDPADAAVVVDWLGTASEWAIRVNAVRALGRMVNAVPDDVPERLAAAVAARDALVRALDDRSHHVRRAAAEALAAASPTAATDTANALVARLKAHEREPVVYGALLGAIARAGLTDVVMDRWLALTDSALRRSAVGALAHVPGSAAFDQLASAATDRDARLASAALSALIARRALDIADPTDERYFETYATALRARDLAVSYGAAAALADSSFASMGAGPLLQSVLLQMRAPDDAEAMVEMIRALGVLRDETAVALLRELRAGRWPELRAAAAAALARITGEPSTLPPFEPAQTRLMQWEWLAQWGASPRIRLETERGTIVLELSTEQAPLTAQTMLTLVAEGRFDDTPFHRVVPNFVIQGGDVSRGDGWGGPGFTIRSELTRIPYLRGTAGMASSGKDTEGSQWFVTHSMQPHLDVAYSAFGTIVDGLGVVDAIREGDRVIRATAQPTAP